MKSNMDKTAEKNKLLKNKRNRTSTKDNKNIDPKSKIVKKTRKATTNIKKQTKQVEKSENNIDNSNITNKNINLELDKSLIKGTKAKNKIKKHAIISEKLIIEEVIKHTDHNVNVKEPKSKSKKRNLSESKAKQKANLLEENNVNETIVENKKNKKKKKQQNDKEETLNPILQNFITQAENQKPNNQNSNSNSQSENLIPNFTKQSNQAEKPDKEKTLLDFINDSKSGIPMKVAEIEKINNIQASAYSKEKSKKSSMTLSCSNLSEMMVNNLERETYKFLKPKVIIEADGSMRIEKPNYIEIAQKIQDENFKKNFPYIVHNNEKHKITSASFRKSSHSDKWSAQETQLFYEALTLFGCNFSYLEIILKPRTRDQIKKKFSREEKYNKEKIEDALLRNKISSDFESAKGKESEKLKLVKFANILKNFKEEKKKEEKSISKKSKYSKYNDSDVTLSNYDNAEIYDFYNGDDKRTSGRINSNLNLKENESGSKSKEKNDKSDNTTKNVDNLYSKILFDENVNGKNSLSQENFKKLMNDLEENSQSEHESDGDSIEREKEKYKNYAANTRNSNRIHENNQRNNIAEEKDSINIKAAVVSSSSSTQNRKEALNKKVEDIIENNKGMKAIIEANKGVDTTQQVFDFLANFK